VEGATYVWSFKELKEALTDEEFSIFSKVYHITEDGNFEGSNHLIRKNDGSVKEIEVKLLGLRKTRKQPSRDDKILCGNNALLAIALIQAGRFLDRPDLEVKAGRLVNSLIDRFWDGTTLAHSYYNGLLQRQGFLSDAASLFTAITMLFEGDHGWQPLMRTFEQYVLSFRDGEAWVESGAVDFRTVFASWFDHPVPSGVGLAELGLARAALLNGKDISEKHYRQSYQSDFYNITAMVSNGLFHIITSQKAISWNHLPVNSILLRGEIGQDCYLGSCHKLDY
jgi:uncharacterized protein YyaL (SSP411 family)